MTYVKGYIESAPLDSAIFDVVISNGVINLCADKAAVFRETRRPARALRHRDRVELPGGIVCNATLWAACIGGALQQDEYRHAIEAAGFEIVRMQDNPSYRFISDNAQAAGRKYGVKSVSLLAVRR